MLTSLFLTNPLRKRPRETLAQRRKETRLSCLTDDEPNVVPPNEFSDGTHHQPHIRAPAVLEVEGPDFWTRSIRFFLNSNSSSTPDRSSRRGAFHQQLTREVTSCGVVAASGGNHGGAVAYAAMSGKAGTIFVPSVASPAKRDRIRGYGAELVITGDRYAESLEASETWTRQSGALPIHAYEGNETLLGQGTLGMELEEQSPKLDSLLVAVGGGE